MNRISRWMAALAAVALLAAGCSSSTAGDRRTVVASFYPLAFLAQRISGPGWEVLDLTPPGAEAHDVELGIEDRAAIENADLVAYLGDIGFQPQVEAAVEEASGVVVAAADGLELLEGEAHEEEEGETHEGEEELTADPHVWLDPVTFATVEERVTEGLVSADPDGRDGYEERAAELRAELEALDGEFQQGLQGCRFDTMIVSHEAFGYLAQRYGLGQLGVAGLEPEGEPTAERLAEAAEFVREQRAGAIFYEAGAEAQQVAETVASDAGVPALPLYTLEGQPESGDYLTVMRDNLESLREGLDCR
ncbi:MAG: metal ABC transporter substrate-binding protein [Actinomycetota bacterium]